MNVDIILSVHVQSACHCYRGFKFADSALNYHNAFMQHTHTHTHTGPGWLMETKGPLYFPFTPTIIVMPQLSQHKRDDDRWYSQPFYSWPGGYKLCLSVDANGHGSGKGTHVSVFVHLMKGENDHQLQWPFKQDVTYGILNWKKDENHPIKTVDFKTAPKEQKQGVTSREKTDGWGFSEFVPHSSLSDAATKDTQYLHNDCLCLQVFKVEPPK